MLHTIRRFWYLFTLLFILLGSSFGGWSWFIFSHLYDSAHGSPLSVININQHIQKPLHLLLPIHAVAYDARINKYKVHAGAQLIIPLIEVNAPLEAVGIASDGSMALPTQHPWDDVGWYAYGPYPGEVGSAVLAGHLNRPDGSSAVFWKLRLLHRGNIVIIKERSGRIMRFSVLDLQVYTLTQAPKQRIFGQRGGAFLNLITCAGVWQPALHQTNQRLIVYTKLLL